MTLAPFPDETIQTTKDALSTITACVEMFVNAREEGKIRFDDTVVRSALELIASMLARAAQAPEKIRNKKFRHWTEHGRQRCYEIIEQISYRENKILARDDLTAFLEKETDGYVAKLVRAQPEAEGI